MARQDASRKNYSALRRRLVACRPAQLYVAGGPLCPYLYSDRVGLREGAGGVSPFRTFAHVLDPVPLRCGQIRLLPPFMVPLHCLPASQATPVLFVT